MVKRNRTKVVFVNKIKGDVANEIRKIIDEFGDCFGFVGKFGSRRC